MEPIPKHIVLFPDGNRRWATQQGIGISEGYLKGKDKFNEFLRWCKDAGVATVTVFGFSSENWRRPQDQVDFLMRLFEKYLGEGIEEFNRVGVRVTVIGQRDKLSESLKKVVERVEKATSSHDKLRLNLAVSYGGRWDIVNAAKQLLEAHADPGALTEESFARHLSTAGQPDPDLIIRAGGETRLSNFVLWQGAYSELYFSPKLWPDFNKEDFDAALQEYATRQRRYGS